jgi:acyl-CoA hydrolase
MCGAWIVDTDTENTTERHPPTRVAFVYPDVPGREPNNTQPMQDLEEQLPILVEPAPSAVNTTTLAPPVGRPLSQPGAGPQRLSESFAERLKASETRLSKAVLPNTTNHYNTLFGGTAMLLMDEVAFICATRFTRKRVVTASSDRIDFKRSIPAGTIIELVARVSYVGRTSLKVRVDILVERMFSFECEKAITGELTFVAVDEEHRPIPVF